MEASDSLELRVFEDLTSKKGLYLTDGLKFGADFLAYEGDPLLYHAKFLVKLCSPVISAQDLIVYERMANTNKKVLLLAYEQGGSLEYLEVAY